MGTKLGSLLVDLELNSAQLRSGLDAAKNQLKGFGDSVKGISDKLSAFSTLAAVKIGVDAVKGLASFVEQGAEAADRMGKMAQSAGVGVESFSRLNYAANMLGVGTEDLGIGFSHLSKKLGEAGAGNHDAAAIFQALGVQVKDAGGHVRATDAVFNDLAGTFANLDKGASKNTLAFELFGKSYGKLLPLLNAGKEGLAAWAAEADRFGFTVTEKGAASAAEFEESLKRIKAVGQGLAIQVAGEVTPALANLTTQLLKSTDGTDALHEAGTILAGTFKVLLSGGVLIAAVFEAAGVAIARTASAVVDAASGNFDGLLSLQQGVLGDFLGEAATAKDRISAIWSGDIDDSALKKLAQAGKKSADDIVSAFEQAKKQLGKTLDEIAAKLKLSLAHSEFERGRKEGKLGVDLGERQATFGLTSQAVGLRAIAAFSGFGDALSQYQDAMIANISALNDVTRFEEKAKAARERALAYEKAGDAVSAANERRKADAAERNAKIAQKDADALEPLAKKADEAAKAFEQFAAKWAEMSTSLGGKLGRGFFQLAGGKEGDNAGLNAAASLGQNLAGKLGQLGQIADAASQGFQAGGPWGAAIAAFAELLMQSKQFKKLIDLTNEMIQMWADAFGELLQPIVDITAASKELTQAVTHIFGDLFKTFTSTLLNFTPFIRMAAMALQVLLPFFDSFQQVIALTTQVFDPMQFALRELFYVMKAFTVWLLNSLIAMGQEWNLAIAVIAQFFEVLHQVLGKLAGEIHNMAVAIGDNPIAGVLDALATAVGGASTWFGGLSKNISNAAVPLKSMQDAADKLANSSFDDLGKSANDAAANLVKFGEQLTNVPEGFKTALTKYASQSGGGYGPGSDSNFYNENGPPGSGSGLGQGLSGAPQKGTTVIQVDGHAVLTQLVDLIINRMAQGQYIRTGSSVIP